MQVALRKWGHSVAIRIPRNVVQAAHLAVDDVVEVREESGRVVIEPLRRKVYDLSELVSGITAANRHEPVDFGPAVGNEVW
ncbi:MAG TPA: AbrB/MazE/SpoVT family DNA-binding domain-containing protein [Methylomirabilota bacterium]|nr:AbrB/MazE/SpoVT family DNA-binding domain-containing protein [Methylomirabilota bacterium]